MHPAGDARNEGQGEFDYRMDDAYRDLGVEPTYEYGSRAGIWRLLSLFEEYGVKTTFFAAASPARMVQCASTTIAMVPAYDTQARSSPA